MAHFVDIFLQPGNVFPALRERPTFAAPLLLVALGSAVMLLLYFLSVDPAWYLDHVLATQAGEMTAKELAQAKQLVPGARTMAVVAPLMMLIGLVVAALVHALYFLLAGRILGMAVSFRQGLSLVAWSGMPMLLGLVVTIVGVLTMATQTSLESLALLNLDPLLLQLPPDSPWKPVASGVSLLSVWVVFLGALGWRSWGRAGWGQAITVAALPFVVVHGAAAIFAILR